MSDLIRKPSEVLREGVRLLDAVLEPCGFHFEFRAEGVGSGGPYAWGEFVRDERRLELHFRYSLGLVTYHVGGWSLGHSAYVDALGATTRAQYPGRPADALSGFRHLAHDLAHVMTEFTTGPAAIFRTAAEAEAAAASRRQVEYMAWAVGDLRKREEARRRFHAHDYATACALLESLQYPELATKAEQRMLVLARERALERR